MRLRDATLEALADDLDAAVRELTAALGAAPDAWGRGRPGKWTAGQHVAHVGISLRRSADDFEAAEGALRAGALGPAPASRGPLQRLFLWLVAERGVMPRGARTAAWAEPAAAPERAAALAALELQAGRHRALAARLDEAARARLWIENPFRPGWHYRLPEMMRVQAVHARHHAKQVAELVAAR